MMTRTFQVINGVSVSIAANYEDPKIFKIEGYMRGASSATQYFLQLHNLAFGELVNTTSIPVRSWQILGTDGFTFNFQPTGLTTDNMPGGLNDTDANWIVVLSTTDLVYTAVAGGVTCDINVDVEEYEIELAGTTTIDQSGASLSQLQVLADPQSPPKSLCILKITEKNAAASFIQLFAQSIVTNVTIPIAVFPLAASASIVLNFGTPGKPLTSESPNGAVHTGIIVGISTVPGVFDANGRAGILAIYK